MGGSVLANLERCKFDGDIHLVSRSRPELNGRACVPSIDDLPHGVDAAVLVIPQTAVIDAIAACGRRGIGAAIVFASGYAEVGDAGRAEQEQLAAAARAANVAILGPNCIGMCSFAVGAALTFEFNVERPPASGAPKIGMVAQSGAVAAIMRMAFLAKGLGVSFYISTGNEADLTAEDFLGALIDDDDTQVAALFVEQIRHPQRFLALAKRARAIGKPIVVMHPGRSQRARISASSHTGALAGDYAVMTALLRHAAVIVVDTLEELVDTAELLARFKPPVKGPGIITNSGAIKGFALDFCDGLGLDIPRLGEETLEPPEDGTAAVRVARQPGRRHRAGAARSDDLDALRRGAAGRSGAGQPVRADGARLAQARDGQGAGAAPADPRGRQARDHRGARRRFPDPAGIHRGVSRQRHSGAALARARVARARACHRVWPQAGSPRDRRAADLDTGPAAARDLVRVREQDLSRPARRRDAERLAGARCRAGEGDRGADRLSGRAEGPGGRARAQERRRRRRAQYRGCRCARRRVATRDRKRRRQTSGPRARRHAGRGDGAARCRTDRRRAPRSAMGAGPAWSGSAASGPRRSTTCG